MSETYEFTAAKPIARTARKGAGRKPDPNPFLEAVKAIAGQVGAEGVAEAREARVVLDAEHAETFKTRRSRIRRQLTAAGKLAGAVIEMRTEPIEGTADYKLTFWDRDAGR